MNTEDTGSNLIYISPIFIIYVIYIIFLFSKRVRDFYKKYYAEESASQPSFSDTFTLISIILAVIAIIASLGWNSGAIQSYFYPIHFLSFSTIFLFIFIQLKNFIHWFPIYMTSASFQSGLFCLGCGLFSLIYTILPDYWWLLKQSLWLIPISSVIYNLSHILLVMNFSKKEEGRS